MDNLQKIKRSILRELRQVSLRPEIRRLSAYHEAGHAVMLWFTGRREDLRSVDMRPKLAGHARVNCGGVSGQPSFIAGLPKGLARAFATRAVMFSLGGPGAENRAGENWPDWLGDLWESGDWESNPHCDLAQAVQVSKVIERHTGRAERFLFQVAGYVDEAMRIPRVWHAVELLAKRLQTVKSMSVARVDQMIDAAWGGPDWVPCVSLGRKWRRRVLGRKVISG